MASKGKISAEVLRWRRKQSPGKIMKPSTFEDIVENLKKKGFSEERARKQAGRAYWNAVLAKYHGKKGRRAET